jgi:hypothetical protein
LPWNDHKKQTLIHWIHLCLFGFLSTCLPKIDKISPVYTIFCFPKKVPSFLFLSG